MTSINLVDIDQKQLYRFPMNLKAGGNGFPKKRKCLPNLVIYFGSCWQLTFKFNYMKKELKHDFKEAYCINSSKNTWSVAKFIAAMFENALW